MDYIERHSSLAAFYNLLCNLLTAFITQILRSLEPSKRSAVQGLTEEQKTLAAVRHPALAEWTAALSIVGLRA
jgi:hypothetical protein